MIRVAKSISKLQLKNILDLEDAQEALEYFRVVINQYPQSTVSIPGDPKNIAISVFTDVLKNSSFAYSIEELAKRACEKNEYVKSYLVGGSNNNHNHNQLLKLKNNRKYSVYMTF